MNNKVKYTLVGAAIIGGLGYYVYKNKEKLKQKWVELTNEFKHVEIDESDIVTLEEIQKRREIHKGNLELEARKTKIEGIGEVDADEIVNYDDWFTNNNGDVVRHVSPVEKIMGIEYDPTIEEVIELADSDGNLIEMVRKLENHMLNNSFEQRAINDVVESVESYADSIELIKKHGKGGVDDLGRTFDIDSTDRFDYYIALILSDHKIEDMELRRKLINLFTWNYTPSASNIADTDLWEFLQHIRTNFFTFDSKYIHMVSIAEVIIHFAARLIEEGGYNRHTLEEYVAYMVNNIPLNFDGSEHDAIIHDTLISITGHDRSRHPNISGGFGLFGITEDDYESTGTLKGEFERFLNYFVDDPDYRLPFKVVED